MPPSLISSDAVWEPLAKGGEFARYYSDLSLLVFWRSDGRELAEENRKVNGQVAQSRQASEYYRRPGGTYSKRSAKGFSCRALPAGCIIGTKGPAVLSESDVSPAYIIGWLNSRLIRSLIHFQANAYEFNTGIVKRLPWKYAERPDELADDVRQAMLAMRREASLAETNSCFSSVMLAPSLRDIARNTARVSAEATRIVAKCQTTWDEAMDNLYCVDSTSLESITVENGESSDGDENQEDSGEPFQSSTSPTEGDCIEAAHELVAYCIGACVGRWDIRIALDSVLAPKLPAPFEPLPVCSPGMLVGPDGLPTSSGSIVSEDWLRARPGTRTLPPDGTVSHGTIPDSAYPLGICWDGVWVDDSGLDENQPHPNDIVCRVREALELMWKDRAYEIEQEACGILGVPNLRDYLRRPSGFFDGHLKRYSKSRRKAPVYWPLSTASGGYTVWVYYHRLTEDTLYRIVSDYVSPKISQIEGRVVQREAEHRSAQGRDVARVARELADLTALLQELRSLHDELLRVAHLPYRPNRNDGVQITAAPLWRLFRLPRWRSELERTWQALERGDYDWAHLAYAIWPERVRETCRHDRSIAIAHGLEELSAEGSVSQQEVQHRQRLVG